MSSTKLSLILTLFISFLTVVTQIECNSALSRLDCYPDPNADKKKCINRGCKWQSTNFGSAPWCFTTADNGYEMLGVAFETPIGYRVNLTRANRNHSYFGGDFDKLVADFEFWEDHHLRIKISPVKIQRFEVPLKLEVPAPITAAKNPLYEIQFSNSPVFSFKILRKSSGSVIFDTSIGGLNFADQFIQIATKLPSTNVYGIGENEQHSFRHKFNNFHWYGLWASDVAPNGNSGVQPYYTVVEKDGNTHSVMIVNANAMEFVILPAPGITYRTFGGLIDFHFFLGPTPENTVQQFTKVVGRAHIPPYWALGFQLSRWGYNNLKNMKAAVERTAKYEIPHDVQYGDIDIMDRDLDFTVNPVNFAMLPKYVKELKQKGIKFVTILNAGINPNQAAGKYRPFDLGTKMDVWIKRHDGTPVIGFLWPGDIYFPDYSENSTRDWWITLLKEFHKLIEYDGICIDMNEPASWSIGDAIRGCANNTINNPPYSGGSGTIFRFNLFQNTLCPDIQQEFGLHYNTHNLYGWSQSEPTLKGVREALGKRGIVLTRSSFLGVGKWAAHWLGDNFSRWPNLHYSIIGMLQFNHFGIPFVGADICGFNENATAELCQRWQQLGAFYPFARNHNAEGCKDQDPGYFGPEVANSTRKALLVRYNLLSYLYTLFYEHSTKGSTVVRALWHEFPMDSNALGIDRQFLWGNGLLVTPVLDEGHRTVTGYFPDARWYDYFSGTLLSIRHQFTTLSAPFDVIHVHLRGGVIFPTQEPAVNTELSRKNPYGLIIALDDALNATGNFYIDDGDSIEPTMSKSYFEMSFQASKGRCTGTVLHNGFLMTGKFISSIRLLGAGNVKNITLNGIEHEDFLNEPSGEVKVKGLKLTINNGFEINWK